MRPGFVLTTPEGATEVEFTALGQALATIIDLAGMPDAGRASLGLPDQPRPHTRLDDHVEDILATHEFDSAEDYRDQLYRVGALVLKELVALGLDPTATAMTGASA